MPFHTRQLFLFSSFCEMYRMRFSFLKNSINWQCSRDTSNLLGKVKELGHTHCLALCVGRSSLLYTPPNNVCQTFMSVSPKVNSCCAEGPFFIARVHYGGGLFLFFRVAADSAHFPMTKKNPVHFASLRGLLHRLILTIVGICDLEDDRDKPAATLRPSLLAFTLRSRDDGGR